MMSSASAAQIVSQDVVEDIVQDILDNILDEVLKDIEEEDEGHAAEIGGRVPSISFNDLAPEEEVAPFDEAALRQRIAMAIAMLDDFYKFRPKREAGAADESDAKSESDMTCSDEPTSPASTGLHSPFASDANESDTSYSEEPSCEIEELDIEDLELEETATPPHRLLENNNAASYGEIPLEHLANPEKYSNQYFRIKKSKLGGNGVFAKVDLKQGQLILVERPEIVACPESLYNELEELSPEVRNAFLRMHAHKRCPDQDHRSAILLTNAFAIQERSCVYLIAARFNHSCQDVRTVEYCVKPNRVMEFRMMKDVPAGTELTISYGPLTPRQLYSMWGFRCACGGCTPITDEEVARIDRAVHAKGIW